MNVTLKQLKAFVAVAELSSFTAAATRLHLTQAALSMLVKELEKELEVVLFDRSTRQVTLTAVGRIFLSGSREVLERLSWAVTDVLDAKLMKTGMLRVAAPQLMACTVLPNLLANFKARYEGLQIRVVDVLPEGLLQSLDDGRAELALGQDLPTDDSIVMEILVEDEHLCVATPEVWNYLGIDSQYGWEQLEGQAFIFPTRDFRSRFYDQLPPSGQRLMDGQSNIEVSYVTTALGLASAGLGITMCPSYASALVSQYGLVGRPLPQPGLSRQICIYHKSRASLSPPALAFLEELKASLL